MADIEVGIDKYKISSEHGRWRCCDLPNGFLVLVSDVIDHSYIAKVLEESDFENYEYNTVFKNQRNRSWCIRFKVDKSEEAKVQSLLEKFNV